MSAEAGHWDGTTVVTDPTWGDNGKGKVIDTAVSNTEPEEEIDAVIRFNGGDNAGHTVEANGRKVISHALPSGLLAEPRADGSRVLNIITQGSIINPINIIKEIQDFRNLGVQVDDETLMLDTAAHLIMPWHIQRDKLSEVARGSNRIGTTGRGIGPTYADKADRVGLRLGDLYREDFDERFKREFNYQERLVRLMNNEKFVTDLFNAGETDEEVLHLLAEESKKWQMNGGMNRDEIFDSLMTAREFLRPMVQRVLPVIRQLHQSGKNILGEAGQAGMLDSFQGNYPNVTPSHPGRAGFQLATNLHHIDRVVAVNKAYQTKVGGGPMPTEDKGELGEHLRTLGHEFGATTGRPRRTGWLDAVAMKYGLEVTGATELAITKLDILDGFKSIKVCAAYEVDGTIYHEAPDGDNDFFAAARPVYLTMAGWNESTRNCRTFGELPRNAQRYLQFIQEYCGLPITWVGVGPDRNEIIRNGR